MSVVVNAPLEMIGIVGFAGRLPTQPPNAMRDIHAPSEVVWILGVLAVVLLSAMIRRSGTLPAMGAALVLRRFYIDEPGASGGAMLHIVGRKPGIIAWMMTTIGFNAETSLVMNSTEITFRQSSLSGQFNNVIPLPNVSCAQCGFYQPIWVMVLAIIFIIAGIVLGLNDAMPLAIAGFVLGLILAIVYSLSRSMFIGLETVGGSHFWIRFKRSHIEGVNVDMDAVSRTVNMVNRYVVFAQRTSAVGV